MRISPSLPLFAVGFAVALATSPLRAEVKLNGLFSDHMVLQSGEPVPVWGSASPKEKVSVEFAGQTKTAEADAQGRWRVTLDSLTPSSEPRSMTVKGSNEIVVKDAVVGEVWLASGQSNIDAPLFSAHNSAKALPEANDPLIRFFIVKKKVAAEPQSLVSGGSWEITTPQTAKNFSAVGYFFARDIQKARNCPVGIIQGAWGGTPIQAWFSLEAMKKDPPIKRSLDEWDKAVVEYEKVKANPQLASDYEAQLKKWKAEVEPSYNAAMKAYNADKAAGKEVEKPEPAWPEPLNPDPMGMPSPSKRPHTPGVSFNAMIAPLIPYALRGVLWYQGEENGSVGMDYRVWLPRLIGDWRERWGNELNFLIVQLPCFGKDKQPVASSGWPWVREAQAMALQLPRTAMAVTIDVGDPKNVHPADKLDVGQRLALAARKLAYEENIVASGPVFDSFKVEDGGKVRLKFREIGGGLTIGQSPWYAPGVAPFPKDKLVGFFVAGNDKNWVEADAVIEGDSVVVSSASVADPAAVRYGWAASPRCNLYNSEGLPAAPFRTDDWPQ